MAPELRSKQFIFRVSPTEVAMLQAVAEYTGLTAADALRSYIRTTYREIHGDKKPTRSDDRDPEQERTDGGRRPDR